MTDLDVALRVRLDYQSGAAKTALADMEAIRAGAARVGAQVGPSLVARGLGDLGKQAAVSKVGVEQLTAAGGRLDAVARSSRTLAGDMRGVGTAAVAAGQAVRQVGDGGGAPGPAVIEAGAGPVDPEADRLRAAIKARRAAGGFASGAELDAFLKGFDQPAASPAPVTVRPAAAASTTPPAASAPAQHRPSEPSAGSHHDAKAEAHIAAMWPSAANPDHPAFARRPSATASGDGAHAASPDAVAGRRAVEALGRSAEALGAGAGPRKLAEGIAALSPAATEARRHVDDVGAAARTAERDLERMGQAASGGRGGGAGDGHGDEPGAAGGGRGHAGPGGLRGALIAGARPLHMERLVMSAFTPIGLAGLAGGLGLAEVGRQMKAVEEQAASFEAAMVGVRRAVGDMPAEGLHEIEKTILGVSSATGASKEELAGLAAAAARAGRPLADLPRFLDVGAKAAGVMGVKVDEAGERLVTLGRAWGKDQAGIEDTVDAVALASGKTGAKPADVLDFTTRHSDMRARNMSARQVAAFGAGFQGAGLEPGQAEGAFSSLSEKLTNPQNAGPQFEQDLNLSLGINPTQARVGMRSDPTRQMVGVLDKLKALPEGKRENVIERMFGAEGGRDIGRVVDHLDELKRTLGLVEDQGQRSGALERAFKVFDDTTNAKIERAGRAFEGFAARLGSRFLPAVKAAADGTAKLFDGLSRYMDTSDQAATILNKQEKGEALTPAEQKGVDHDPKLRQFLGMDADPEATKRATEGERSRAEANIHALEKSARENDGDPQIKAMAEQAKQDYREKFPGAPIAAFAAGGRVTGPGGPRDDKVHAKLSAGEFVIRAAMVDKHPGLVRAINDDAVPAYAAGGPVRLAAGAPTASAAGMPVRALQRGIERGTDAAGVARLLATLGPEAHGKPLTVEQIKEAINAGTKAGVVAGMREAMDMGGRPTAARGLVQAADGAAAGEGGDGEGGGGGRPLEHPSLRYGGGYGPGGRLDPDGSTHHRSMRYGGGYGPRSGPAREVPSSGQPHPHGRPLDPERLRVQARRHGRARPHDDDGPAPDGSPRPPMPGGGEGRADPESLKGVLFKGESGGNPGIYNHRVGGRYLAGHLDPNNTTVAELTRRQGNGEVFAAGKYQIIPQTMKGAVKALGLKGDEKFDSALQDRIYTDYLAGSKRPAISAYVTGKSDDLRGANVATAEEWASVGDPSRGGRGHYDGDGANHASISVGKAQAALQKARADYQRFTKAGMDPETARRSALLGIRDPQAPGHPATPTPVAARQTTPAAAGAHPAAAPRTAAAQPAAPAGPQGTLRLASGGRVTGPGGPREDRVPALLSHGEFIVKASAAAKHPGLLAAINDDHAPSTAGRGATSLPGRFTDPAERPSPARSADAAGGADPGAMDGQAGGGAPPVQHFYGQFDPVREARRSMMESNREVRRSQARAMHSLGRTG